MKTSLKEAWNYFWNFGFPALLLILAVAITVYRLIHGQDIRAFQLFFLLLTCVILGYRGYRDWEEERAKKQTKGAHPSSET